MIKKLPETIDEHLAEAEEALKLGINSIEDYRKAKPIAIKANEFLAKKLPKKEFIIHPCLPKQGLVMIYAKRGVGKTYFALTLAHAISQGISVFGDRWKVSKKWNVLYIDGEMAANSMQERLKSLSKEFASNDNFSIITRDLQVDGRMPNLATEEGQASIEEHVANADVVVVDNLSTLMSYGKENEANSWDPVANWALRLRSIGKSIIFIHHAGKDNSQRGTSKKEDILDTIINLRHPTDYNSEEGARFEIHFEKSRGFAGEEAKAFEVKLSANENDSVWNVSEIEDLNVRRVIELHQEGLSQRDIANESGLSLSKVNRILKGRRQEPKKT